MIGIETPNFANFGQPTLIVIQKSVVKYWRRITIYHNGKKINSRKVAVSVRWLTLLRIWKNAVATYITGSGSYRSIASMFGIPKSTLREKKGNHSLIVGLSPDYPTTNLLLECTGGHVILAEFEKMISPVIIDSFTKTLKNEELGEESHQFPATPASRLDFSPISTIPKSSRNQDPPSPILTGEKARKQLSGIEQRKRQQGETRIQNGKAFLKKNLPQGNEDFNEDIYDGYLQYMEMNGHFLHESLPTPGPSGAHYHTGATGANTGKEKKARRRNDKFIIEGSRRSSRLQARLKVVDCSESVVPSAIVDNKIQRELPIVLCTLCKSTEVVNFDFRNTPYSTFLPSEVRIRAEHPLDIHVLNG
ncbi:hypothetical protein OUZ56_010932 [Daphnia magna]|uniref:HTH psq-type domain-containing protein n=1 Tax=Daphnia magna TaxID=35525 RepID=A0ABQ9YZ93_9CRUS|nr:hypothetical protein OUZ56_010932 [Daphnia magna]